MATTEPHLVLLQLDAAAPVVETSKWGKEEKKTLSSQTKCENTSQFA